MTISGNAVFHEGSASDPVAGFTLSMVMRRLDTSGTAGHAVIDISPPVKPDWRCPRFPGSNRILIRKGKRSSAGKTKRYSPEFKEQAAKKVVDNSLPIVRVARELGINESTLGFWVKGYRDKLARQSLPPGMPGHEHRTVYDTRRKAHDDIARWIEPRHNRTRLRSGLGYRTPQEVMDEYRNGQAAA